MTLSRNKVKLRLQTDNLVVPVGGQVSGTLHVDVLQDVELTAVRVTLHGEEFTTTDDERHTGNDMGYHTRTKQTFTCFGHTKCSQKKGGALLTRGSAHSYPFTLTLPPTAAPTYAFHVAGKSTEMRYTLTGYVDIPNGIDRHVRLKVLVLPTFQKEQATMRLHNNIPVLESVRSPLKEGLRGLFRRSSSSNPSKFVETSLVLRSGLVQLPVYAKAYEKYLRQAGDAEDCDDDDDTLKKKEPDAGADTDDDDEGRCGAGKRLPPSLAPAAPVDGFVITPKKGSGSSPPPLTTVAAVTVLNGSAKPLTKMTIKVHQWLSLGLGPFRKVRKDRVGRCAFSFPSPLAPGETATYDCPIVIGEEDVPPYYQPTLSLRARLLPAMRLFYLTVSHTITVEYPELSLRDPLPATATMKDKYGNVAGEGLRGNSGATVLFTVCIDAANRCAAQPVMEDAPPLNTEEMIGDASATAM